LIGGSHFDTVAVKKISEDVSFRWRELISAAEERHKLFSTALAFYKTAEQVSSVLESLEREYRRPEETSSLPLEERRKSVVVRLQKHEEQKGAFMKACSELSTFDFKFINLLLFFRKKEFISDFFFQRMLVARVGIFSRFADVRLSLTRTPPYAHRKHESKVIVYSMQLNLL